MAKPLKDSVKKLKSKLIDKVRATRDDKVEKGKKKKKAEKEPEAVKKSKKVKPEVAEKATKKSKKADKVEKAGKSKKAAKPEKVAKAKKSKRGKEEVTYKAIKSKHSRTEQMTDLIARVNLGELLPKHEFSERDEKKIAKAFMDALTAQIAGHIMPGGSGLFQIPGLLKVVTKHVPAKPKRKGINPFTKEEQVFPAKPATTRVKARPMKRLKDMAL